MNTLICLAVVGLAVGALSFLLHILCRLRLKLREADVWVITCPEARQPAAVEVTKDGGFSLMRGRRRLELTDCSLWPGSQDCGRTCLKRIGPEPAEHLARTATVK
jgi:hypothetical protein